jgi:hypothetical protein
MMGLVQKSGVKPIVMLMYLYLEQVRLRYVQVIRFFNTI